MCHCGRTQAVLAPGLRALIKGPRSGQGRVAAGFACLLHCLPSRQVRFTRRVQLFPHSRRRQYLYALLLGQSVQACLTPSQLQGSSRQAS